MASGCKTFGEHHNNTIPSFIQCVSFVCVPVHLMVHAIIFNSPFGLMYRCGRCTWFSRKHAYKRKCWRRNNSLVDYCDPMRALLFVLNIHDFVQYHLHIGLNLNGVQFYPFAKSHINCSNIKYIVEVRNRSGV